MEPATARDHWDWAMLRPGINDVLIDMTGVPGEGGDAGRPAGPARPAMRAGAACNWWRRGPDPLPPPWDRQRQAAAWKHYYNTAGGSGSPQSFLTAWQACGLDELGRQAGWLRPAETA